MKQIYSFTTKLLLVAAVCATVLTSCSIRKKEEKGKMVKKEVKVAPFKDLLVDGNATVNIVPAIVSLSELKDVRKSSHLPR